MAHPCERWFTWSGKNGTGWVEYYDKSANNGKGGRIKCNLPFKFVLLDETKTISGYNDQFNTGIMSNEVKNLAHEPLTVRMFKGNRVIARGTYDQIKGQIGQDGGRFSLQIYLLYWASGKAHIGGLLVSGAALRPWIDFRNSAGKEVYDNALIISGHKHGKKGATEFEAPIFEAGDPLPANIVEAATEADKELQKYLDARPTRSAVPSAAEEVQDLPSEEVQDHPQYEPSDNDGHVAEAPEEPAVDDDVPF